MRNLISIEQLGKKELLKLLARAEELEDFVKEGRICDVASNSNIAHKVTVLGLERSHRTAGSFCRAANLLGIKEQRLQEEDTSIPKQESFKRTIRMLLIQGASILVIRTKYEGSQKYAINVVKQSGYNVPIINAGDGRNRHPSQTLLDLRIMGKKFGRLENLLVAFFGDVSNSRVAHDFFSAAAMFGIRIGVVSSGEIPKHWLRGVKVEFISEDPKCLLPANVLYALRPQLERMSSLEKEMWLNSEARIDPDFLDRYCPDAILLHAQPINKECDPVRLYPGLDDDPRFRTLDEQAWGGIPVRMAILQEAFAHREEEEELPKPLFELLTETKKRKLKEASYKIKPIEGDGTTLDHLQENTATIVEFLIQSMGVRLGPTYMGKRSDSSKMGKKDILQFEGVFLPDIVKAAIGILEPEVTFNEFRGSELKKEKLASELQNIPVSFPCLNPDCISRADPECQSTFSRSIFDNKVILACSWCEREFEPNEIWRHLRFKLTL